MCEGTSCVRGQRDHLMVSPGKRERSPRDRPESEVRNVLVYHECIITAGRGRRPHSAHWHAPRWRRLTSHQPGEGGAVSTAAESVHRG